MRLFIPILGIFVFYVFSWLISENRRRVPWRAILNGTAALVLLSAFFLATPIGIKIQETSGSGITLLVRCADEGVKSMFSPKLMEGEFLCVAFSFLPSIIFIGSLSAILFHLGVLQLLIRAFACVVTRLLGVSGAEALIAASNIFLGMVEAPFAVRPYLEKFTRSELFCMMTSGMATIAGGVMVVYAGMLQRAGTSPGHLIIASILSVFSSVIIAKIMIPETEETQFTGKVTTETPRDANLIDAACRGAGEGTTLAINVLGMLIAFTALITLVNLIFSNIGDVGGAPVTLQRIFAWIFSPIAWFLGVPWKECGFAGQLLGEKTVMSEFIAYMDMTNPANLAQFTQRTRIIMSYALCGFANFGSLAIMVGGIGSLVPSRRSEIAKLAFRSLISGTLAAFITACLAAIFI